MDPFARRGRREYARQAACVILSLCGAAACALPRACATDYFIASTGSNLNDGTATHPWLTLQYAADRAGPGDLITVRPGNYAGFYLETSGTAAQPIEFRAEPGVLINQRNPTTPDGINLEGASHVVVDGFAVQGMPRAGVRAAGLPAAGMNHVTIRNVRATNNARWGVFTGFVDDLLIEHNETSGSQLEHGIYVSNSGDRPIIRGNVSWGNKAAGIHMNGDASQGGDGVISGALLSGNVIYGNGAAGGSGINMDGVQNSRIENNVLYDNHASGISLYQIDGGGASTGNVVVNNTVVQAQGARAALNLQDGATNNALLNNLVTGPELDAQSRAAVDVSANSLPGLVSDYNIIFGGPFTIDGGDSLLTLAQWRTTTGQDLHGPTPDSLVALYGLGNTPEPRLWPGSMAIDAGTTFMAPAIDAAGVVRPRGTGVDIGAYEYSYLSADFNLDGVVDRADLGPWQSGYGAAFRYPTEGDATGDRRAAGADFLEWQRQFGQSARAASPAGSSVPEPPGWELLLLAWAGLGRRFRAGFITRAPRFGDAGYQWHACRLN